MSVTVIHRMALIKVTTVGFGEEYILAASLEDAMKEGIPNRDIRAAEVQATRIYIVDGAMNHLVRVSLEKKE